MGEAATVAAEADLPMAVEEQALELLKRSAADQEAVVWVAISCDRCACGLSAARRGADGYGQPSAAMVLAVKLLDEGC